MAHLLTKLKDRIGLLGIRRLAKAGPPEDQLSGVRGGGTVAGDENGMDAGEPRVKLSCGRLAGNSEQSQKKSELFELQRFLLRLPQEASAIAGYRCSAPRQG